MIDVAVSSCARIDILEKSVLSAKKHLKSKDGLRFIICEDKVDDKKRQEIGRNWIEKNRGLFDEVIYSKKKLTYVYCFSEILKYVKSDYFFRLEDDVEFDQDIDLDSALDFMKSNADLSQLIFKREVHKFLNPKESKNDTGRKIVLTDFYSVATGIFNTELSRKIVNFSGSSQCHEGSVLSPSMRKLNLKTGVIHGLGRDNALKYVGDNLGYKKGSWK